MNTKEWIDKIGWDVNEDSEDYSFSYINFGKEVEVPYDSIITRDDFSFNINQNGKMATIPYHRIRRIFKHGKVVFSRRIKIR